MVDDFIARHTNMSPIYVIVNQSQTATENQFEVIGATKTIKEAYKWVRDQYLTDLIWIQDICNCSEEELDENTLSKCEGFLQKDEVFSRTSIEVTFLY